MKGVYALLIVLVLACSAFAVSGSSNVRTTNTINTGVVMPAFNVISNATNNSSSSGLMQGVWITPPQYAAFDFVLKTGPYAYVLTEGNMQVIDVSTLQPVATVKPGRDHSAIIATAVSPDAAYIYNAIFWYEYDPMYQTNLYYTDVVRLNASTLQPMDYFRFDNARPRHLAVSPDGKVYFGMQEAKYPENGWLEILDFSQGKSWYVEYDQLAMIYNFEFSPGGKHVYYSAWWDYPKIYDFDTAANKIQTYWLSDNYSSGYIRTLALTGSGQTLYSGIRGRNGIFAMDTASRVTRIVTVDYSPLALAASRDGSKLYALGYFVNSQGKNVYFIHKYSGLQQITPYSLPWDVLLLPENAFTYSSMAYVTPPDGSFPINMEVSADGKFGFISTSNEQGAHNTGSGVIIYDLEYMNQVKTISAKVSHNDVAVGSGKIYFEPPIDFSMLKQFAVGGLSGFSLPNTSMYVKKFYPAPNEFAKSYADEYFEPYAVFTEYVDNTTVSNSTFWLTEKSGAKVSGRAFVSSKIAGFLPDAQLKGDMDYVAHLSKSIKSKDGKALYTDVSWNFTTRNTSSIGGLLANSTLSVTGISAHSLGNAVKLAQAGNGSGNSSAEWLDKAALNLSRALPGMMGNWLESGTEFGSGPQEPPLADGDGTGGVQQAPGGEVGINPQPEPPAPQSQGEEAGTTPQPEPPGEVGNGQAQAPSSELNPQPEPPAPQKDFFSGIVDFFKGLFGWQ